MEGRQKEGEVAASTGGLLDTVPTVSTTKERRKQKAHQRNAKRIRQELIEFTKDPPPGCCVVLPEDVLHVWNADIVGPQGSPYEEGKFKLKITFPSDYPFCPPKVVFKTKIYHCNVSCNGSICLDILKDKWSSVLTIGKVLLSLQSLLGECNPADPLMPDIAKLFIKDRECHDRVAKEWTARYATSET